MRNCYLMVYTRPFQPRDLRVSLYNKKKCCRRGDWISHKHLPPALAYALDKGIYKLNAYDEYRPDYISFPVHPASWSTYPACYGSTYIDEVKYPGNICKSFLLTLIGRIRYDSLTKKGKSHIAYVTVKEEEDK